MTAFEYMAQLEPISTIGFHLVDGRAFAVFTSVSNIGPWRDRQYIITEENGQVYSCDVPPSLAWYARLLQDPKLFLTLPRRPVPEK